MLSVYVFLLFVPLAFFDAQVAADDQTTVDETDDHYYPAKLTGESGEHYKLRMKSLVAALDEEDFNQITFDDNAIGYTIGARKTPTKKTN